MRSIKTEIGDYTGKHYEGDFVTFGNNIESLEGAPKSVGGHFYLTNFYNFYLTSNNLNSLEGAPQFVGGNFNCFNNNLQSLEGAPKSVGGNFVCDYKLLKGENLYIIANALLNGKKDKRDFEEEALKVLTRYFFII